jgi:hypothetical protein
MLFRVIFVALFLVHVNASLTSLQALVHGRIELSCPIKHNGDIEHTTISVKWRRQDGVIEKNIFVMPSWSKIVVIFILSITRIN